MIKGKREMWGVVMAVLFISGTSQGLVVHSENPLPGETIPAVSTYQTNGADMVGMGVTMFFSAAPAETVLWSATGVDSGVAAGIDGDWTLSEAGDTFNNPWTLIYEGGKGLLTGFRLDGFANPGPVNIGVMFDRTFNGDFGTPDSYRGRDFEYVGAQPPFNTFVRYESTIAVGAAPAVGDEFRYLNIQFLYLPGFDDEFNPEPPQPGGLDGDNLRTLSFYQDTNNPVVPEPFSLILLSSGVLLVWRRRKGTL
jgi:hypothetical protein